MNRIATVAHDDIARAERPAHTMYESDAMFCLAKPSVEAPYDAIEVAAADVVARAIAAGCALLTVTKSRKRAPV